MEVPFKKCDILIPKKGINYNLWSVIACDQYTSQLEYWDKVKELVGDNPSTYNIILPEVYLENEDVEDKIKKINETMNAYLNENLFETLHDTMIYLERTDSTGKVREGLIGMIDLDNYDYNVGSKSLVRATEKTVIERIPPRKKVRVDAPLELPHIMILIDDEKKEIIESLKNKVTEEDIVYDFDLMMNGGHSKGYKLSTYATWWIRQAVRRSVSTYSKTIRIPTHRFDLLNKASAVEKRLNCTLQRNPTEEELANELGISVEKLRDLRECDSETVSLSAPINDQESDADELVDFIEDKRVNVEDNVLDEEYLNQFKKALLESKALDKRQKEILFLRFGIDVERPLSLEEVARKYNLTRERIRQIESKAIRRLARDKNIKKFRVSDSPDDMVFPITYYVPRNIYQSSSKNSYSRTKKYYK